MPSKGCDNAAVPAAEVPPIEGAASVVEWFGYWPTFHDAEVLSILLDRWGVSKVKIHVWERTREVDDRGYYMSRKHAFVTFELEELCWEDEAAMELHGFNHQNVLGSLQVEAVDGRYRLVLWSIFGVDGFLSCERMRVRLEPAMPSRAGQ